MKNKYIKKTVVFEFPSDFRFPEHYGEDYIKTCSCCPFDVEGRGMYCLLTGDELYGQEKYHECPFHNEKEPVVYHVER